MRPAHRRLPVPVVHEADGPVPQLARARLPRHARRPLLSPDPSAARAAARAPASLPRAILLEHVPGLLKNDVTREGDGGTVGDDDAKARPRRHPNPSSALPTVLAALSACGYAVSWRLYDSRPCCRRRGRASSSLRSATTSSVTAATARVARARRRGAAAADALHADDDESIDLEAYRLRRPSGRRSRQPPRLDERLLRRDGVAGDPRELLQRARRRVLAVCGARAAAGGAADAGGCPPWRSFAPREVARLQGFPDGFELGEKDEACYSGGATR